MPLDYDLGNIKNYGTVCWLHDDADNRRHMNPVTHNLIFSTIRVGMGEITKDNVHEFFVRLSMMEGFDRLDKTTWEEVTQHIGLKTNVFPKESTSKWFKKFVASAKREYKLEEEIGTDNSK